MPNFEYTYSTNKGEVGKAKVKANSLNQAKAYLKKRKITVISIRSDNKKWYNSIITETVSGDDIVSFSQLFASCINTGLTVKDSLTLLSKQVESKVLQERISQILVDLDGGQSLSNSFLAHTDVFPGFYPMLIKAGEASGNLGKTLDYLGSYIDRINTLKKEIIGVFTYPGIVSVVGMGLLVVIIIFVAPTFKEVFASSKSTLPLPTRILFFISDLVISKKAILLSIFGTTIASIVLFSRTVYGKKKLHLWILRTPLLGKVIREVMMLRFLRAFDILVNNGVPILEALKVMEESTSNLALKDVIIEMRQDVSRGLSLSGPLISHKEIVSPMISYSISMGEKSGNLGETLTRLGQFLDREINFSMKKLSSRLDPLLTMAIGGMVLFVAISIYLPIFDMMSNVQK